MNIARIFRSRIGLGLALAADLLLAAGPQGPPDIPAASLDAALAAQARVTQQWMGRPGVVGTAVGLGAGGQAVVKVYLTAAGAAALPTRVAGVDVVPEVTGPIVALSGPGPGGDAAPEGATATAGDDDPPDPKRGFPRPVPIGVSTGHPGVTAGTIGARVTDGSRVFLLSNNHVAANNNAGSPGDNLLQPGVVDGGRDPDDALATLHDFEPLRFCGASGCPFNTIDAAVGLTTTDDLDKETPDGGYGEPRSRTVEAALGVAVQKYGRTTGHTHGRITGIHAVIDVGYRGGTARFEDQIVISGDGFSAGGDSGSLIVTESVLLADRRPVGLLFAGSANSTIANPIGPVLDRFGVRVDGSWP